MDEREQLKQAMAALEAQRAILGDGVVEAALGPMREKLASLETRLQSADQRRKQVTVLFADVSGFTAMSELLDPEDVTQIMNTLWQRLDRAIQAHGGWIDKHIGDAVMALWGVESTHENDPEQAIRAALEMQVELARFREEVRGDLEMRIGINTGPVLLGGVGTTREFTAMGDTVNLAARLQHVAPLGGVLVSHDTYRHVRGVFDVQVLDPLIIKGKTDPVRVYVIVRPKPRAFRSETRGVEGVETEMVGREAEFQQLQTALLTALEDRQLQALTVMGEAGIGKSRLLYEFLDWSETRPERMRVFKGRASESAITQPYGLLRDMMAFRFEIAENDSGETAREKLERGIVAFMPGDSEAAMKAHFIGHLIGLDFSNSPHLPGILDDARQIRDRALHYLGQLLVALTREVGTDGVIMVLEDLHWADDGSLDTLAHLMVTCAGYPIFILGTARPVLFERRPSWGEGLPAHSRLELRVLSKRESRRLVEEILKKMPEIPAVLREMVVGGAEGNPFYIEELIKMFVDERVIVPGEDQWLLEANQLAQVRIPPTLTKVLQARLDSLPRQELRLLQQASAIGYTFWDSALPRLNVAGDDLLPADQIPELLATLRNREMIFRREVSSFAGAQEYIFKHAILQEVTYESVLLRYRRAYHEAVAEWLTAQGTDKMGEVAGLIAKHLELAGQIERARGYLRRAGEHAAAHFANTEAVTSFTRALELAPETAWDERYDLLAGREACYRRMGNCEAQQADVAQLVQLAAQMADPVRQIDAVIREVELAIHLGNAADTQTRSLKALELARWIGNRKLEADLLTLIGRSVFTLGDHGMSEGYYTEALEIYREIGEQGGQAECSLRLASVARLQGRLKEARNYYQQSLEICCRLGDRAGEANALNALGICASDFAEKISFYEQALTIARAIGDRNGQIRAYNNQALVYLNLGLYDRARDYLENAIKIGREMHGRSRLTYHLESLGRVYLEIGDYARAEQVFREGVALSVEVQERWAEMLHWLGLGRVTLASGRLSESCELLQKACDGLREIGTWGFLATGLSWLGMACLESGDWPAADRWTAEAVTHLQAVGDAGDYPIQQVWWNRYQVLLAAPPSEGAAAPVQEALAQAHAAVHAMLENLSDAAMRERFLTQVEVNARICAEWERRQS